MSIASETLGKLHTKAFLDLAMYLRIGKTFRNLAIEILDCLSFPCCFLIYLTTEFWERGKELLDTSCWMLYFYGIQF